MKSTEYKRAILDLRIDIINDIKSMFLSNDVRVIELHTPLIYIVVDDQTNHCVKRVDGESGKVHIDTGDYDYWLELQDLPLDILIGILESLEDKDYNDWDN
jgi:hypothetical protein